MIADNHGSGHRRSEGPEAADPVDFRFLKEQTFDDVELQRDVLQLFVGQAARIVLSLPTLDDRSQADAAHLLKGSARGIGAWDIAHLADAYEADPAARAGLCSALVAASARAETAIHAYIVDQLGGVPLAASTAPAR